MGALDMPLKELELYNEINPIPIDFEKYWNKGEVFNFGVNNKF